jgi:hypothetical protein
MWVDALLTNMSRDPSWDHVKEHFGNTLRTFTNIMGTFCEHGANIKIPKKPKLLRNQLSNHSQNKLELALTYGDSCEGWTHDLTLGVKKI